MGCTDAILCQGKLRNSRLTSQSHIITHSTKIHSTSCVLELHDLHDVYNLHDFTTLRLTQDKPFPSFGSLTGSGLSSRFWAWSDLGFAQSGGLFDERGYWGRAILVH